MGPVLPDYAFPLLQLLSYLLHRIQVEGTPVILIAQSWPRRTWYSDIVNMSMNSPWTLLVHPNLLLQGPILHLYMVAGFNDMNPEGWVFLISLFP